MVLKELDVKSINYHQIQEILSDYTENKTKYEINLFDKHPNHIAHQLIAEYIVRTIIGL